MSAQNKAYFRKKKGKNKSYGIWRRVLKLIKALIETIREAWGVSSNRDMVMKCERYIGGIAAT